MCSSLHIHICLVLMFLRIKGCPNRKIHNLKCRDFGKKNTKKYLFHMFFNLDFYIYKKCRMKSEVCNWLYFPISGDDTFILLKVHVLQNRKNLNYIKSIKMLMSFFTNLPPCQRTPTMLTHPPPNLASLVNSP